MIKLKTYSICNSLLTNGLLSTYIDLFWKEVFEQLTKGPSVHHLMLMCKISFNATSMDMGYRTLGHLRRVNYSDKELFTEYLQDRLGYLNDSYTSNSLNEITFSYPSLRIFRLMVNHQFSQAGIISSSLIRFVN